MAVQYPPPPGQPPPLQQYPPYPAAVVTPGSTTAVWSLVVGILSWFICPFVGPILAIFLGHLAQSEAHRYGQPSHGMATAGMILGYVHLAIYGLILLLVVVILTGIWAA